MSPEERQLLNGLFDRTRNAAATARDPEAEALIADQVRAQPHMPYLLSQAVLVQEQALKGANERLQALEARIRELEQQAPSGAAPAGGGFLSGLGSLFGSGPQPAQPPQGPPPGSPWQQQPSQGYGQPQPPQGYGQQGYPPPGAGAGPWGGAPGGGGFLKGALGAAAGVAGGVLLADSVRDLFGGHNNSLGIGSGLGGSATPGVGGESIVNNYYENSGSSSNDTSSSDADYADDVADASYDDSGSDDA